MTRKEIVTATLVALASLGMISLAFALILPQPGQAEVQQLRAALVAAQKQVRGIARHCELYPGVLDQMADGY